MKHSIKIGSEFLSITKSADKPWITNVYWGLINGSSHAHLMLSGGYPTGQVESGFSEIWYFRNVENNPLYKLGSPFINNASQLLSNCIPAPLREFQHPEQPLFWNVDSLGSFFLSKPKSF